MKLERLSAQLSCSGIISWHQLRWRYGQLTTCGFYLKFSGKHTRTWLKSLDVKYSFWNLNQNLMCHELIIASYATSTSLSLCMHFVPHPSPYVPMTKINDVPNRLQLFRCKIFAKGNVEFNRFGNGNNHFEIYHFVISIHLVF